MRVLTPRSFCLINAVHAFVAGILLAATASAQGAAALGTNAILVSSAAGSSSVLLSDTAAWTAVSNSSFLHIAPGSSSGTDSALVVFTYDAFTGTGTGTRSGTLTVAGLTLTVTQTGTDYVGPGGLTTLVSSGLSTPTGVSVDPSGNVYFADTGNNAIKEWNASTQQVTTLISSGLNTPRGVAVDTFGNLYIADAGNNAIEEYNLSSRQLTTLVSTGLSFPAAVAVDGLGNVYIADTSNNAIKEYNASTQQVSTLVASGLNNPFGVAVDVAGNVYISDTGNSLIKEWNVSTQAVSTLGSAGSPQSLVVDGSGNVYVGARPVMEWSASTQQFTTLVSGFNSTVDIAVDASGSVYIGDQGDNEVLQIPFAFVGPAAGFNETYAAGNDSTLQTIPPVQPLTGVYAPSSDQSWLSVGTVSGGVVNFSFTQNNTGAPRSANITILALRIPVTQQVAPPAFTCSNNGVPIEVNAGYTTTCTVTSGTGVPPYSWSISAGAFPAGLTYGATATSISVNGAATVAGTAAYTIQLNDSSGATATQAFSGTIAATGAFTCTNNNVPVMTGAAYTTKCTVISGTGVSPFSWSISAGALPAGVTSTTTATSITLTGPATVADPAAYTIQLSDQAGVTATQAFSGVIAGSIVANWTFSNGSNLGADSSGNGYNLIQEGSGPITFDPAALGGQGAAVFNGSDYFDFGGAFPPLLPAGNDSYTIAAWINPGIVPVSAYGIIGWGAYGNYNETNAFRTNVTGVDNYSWSDDAVYDPPNFTLYDGHWHFVAVTYDNTTANRFVYIDPATSSLPPYQSNPNSTLNVQPTTFRVGITCCAEYFVGEISQLQVYNYALPVTQIYAMDNPVSVGNNAILVTSAAGSSSVVLSDSAAWTAVSNSSFLHVAAAGASGTGSAVVEFTYDAFTGTGTRSGTLTVAGIAITVTQTGTNYIGPGGLTTLVPSGLNGPAAVAVDTSGNVYLADALNNSIKEWNASTQQVTTLVPSGLNNPNGVAVDGSGNVYIADTGNNAIEEYSPATQQVTTLVSSGLSSPVAVALDGLGNVYIVDDGNNAIKEYSPSAQQVTTLVSTGLLNPKGVAVDVAGNVYVSDSNNLAIKEWNVSTRTITTLGSVSYPRNLAVDGSGNVYAATGSSIMEWSASTQQFTTLISGLNNPVGVAVDGFGNVYIGDTGDNIINEIPFAFVGPAAGASEGYGAGTDSLPEVIPPTQALTGIYFPSTSQSWLTIGSISGGVVSYSFTPNNTGSPRTANITILGRQIPVTQQSAPGLTITTTSLLPGGTQGVSYGGVTLAATGGSGLAANYRWTSISLPAGLFIGLTTGTIAGTPAAAGDYTGVTITVTDAVSGQSVSKTFMIGIGYPPLTIITSSLPSGQAGKSYSASLQATGGSGSFSWTASGLPGGLSFSSGGFISGTPTAAASAGVFFTVTDPTSRQSAATSLQLSIAALPVVISGSSTADVASGGSLALSYSASGGVPPYEWALSGAPGFSVDSSGNVTGTGPQPGSTSARLTVTDSAGGSSSLSITIAVLGISGSFPAGTTTSSYNGSVTGVGGLPPYSYTASGVPPGLSFGGGTLSGQAQNPGSYSIGVQVTDSKGVTASGNFPFSIAGPAPTVLTISTTSLPDGQVGQPYSQSLSAAGGKPAYTWSQTGGQLPAGLGLSGSGAILGTPTATGAFSFGVQVADSLGSMVVGTVLINVDPAPLVITNGTAFPSGQVGVDYPAQILNASGGTPPYTFGVTGILPPGLALDNGQIDGTPSALGDFNFTVTVADSASPPATAKLGITATIDPNTPDLSLSSSTASFLLTGGTTAVPSPDTILVSATVVSDTINFTTSSSVPWLTAGGSSGTPGSIAIGPNSAALALSPTGSPYSGTVTVTCTTMVCAGKSQTIAVTLTLTAEPPQLALGTALLNFQTQSTNPQSSTMSLSIQNAGGGSLAIRSVSAADGWVSVGSFPETVAPGPGGAVSITANPAGLSAGYYLSSLTVASSAGSLTIPVTLLIAGAPVLTLGPAGAQFSLPQGGALGNPNGSFLVSLSNGSATYSASVLPGTPWLSGGGSGNASGGNPGSLSFSIDQAAVSELAAGAYYGTIQVSGPGISNSPQDFQVILNVSPATTRVAPDPQPAGVIFEASSGMAPSPQTVKLFASSKTALAYQASTSVTNGSGWLSVSPATGSTSAASPAVVSVSASPTGLAPGVYRGAVSFSFASAVRSVNVTLIVESAPAGGSPPSDTTPVTGLAPPRKLSPLDAVSCANKQLVPTQTGLVTNFAAPASWPTPLAVTLVDSCANPVGDGQLIATFSNGDPPLILLPTDPANGLYSATWTPRGTSSQVTVNASAAAPGYTSANVQIAGQVAHNTAPVLASSGALNVFNPQVGAGLGPGNIVQIYGSGLANQPNSPAVLPLPTQVNGTMVIIGGIEAPLYYVSAGQINAQIPFELQAGNQYQVIVSANGALTTPQPIQLTTAVPAVLQFTSGAVEAQRVDGTLVSATSPAVPGEYLVIYLTGLGATDIAVPSGTASPSNPPANVLDTPVLTLNGTQSPVLFAGLTPGLVGLYQINFQIPQTLANGNYTLLVSQGGTSSNQTILAVQQPAPE